MSRLGRILLIVTLLGTAVGASAGAAVAGSLNNKGGTRLLMDLARSFATVVPTPLVQMLGGGQAVSEGSDGRLTFLILGSDTRSGGVSRTDSIMVMSLRGNSMSAVSIPRDMARIPNPDGGVFSARVNGIVRQLKAQGQSTQQALAEFERVIEHLLQIEIDYYAVVNFPAFETMVGEIEPVSIRISKEIRDNKYDDDPDMEKGVYYPQSSSYDLYKYQAGSKLLCNGLWESQADPIPSQYWCRRALPFVRSRKGPGNSDFARSRRQQDFIFAAIRRVIERGSGTNLNRLTAMSNGLSQQSMITTSMPLTAANAMDLYNRLNGANVSFQAVFSPPTYATHIPGGSAYELKLPEVRQVMKQWFGSTGSPPPDPTPTVPPPSSTPTLVPGPTPTLGPGQTPPPTLAPGQTPTPTLAPGETPGPTLAPGQTPTPTLAPGQTPLPTIPGSSPVPGTTIQPGAGSPGPSQPGAVPTDGGVAALPSGATPAPGSTELPVAAAVPTPGPNGNDPQSAIAGQNTALLVAVLVVVLLAGAALFIGWRRYAAARR